MKARIVAVHGDGSAERECLVVEIVKDCDLGDYVVLDSTYRSDHQLSNKHRHIFRFESKQVKAGDQVLLWTKAGVDKVVQDEGSLLAHHYHWGLASAIWNDEGDSAQLLQLADVQSFLVPGTAS
jgi:hypothetical protein